MSLDIGVGDGSSLIPVQSEPSLFLEDDGYYCFLHPLFERLAVETGQYVEREAMLTLLDQWDVVFERARQLGRPIVCFGD